MDFSEIYQEYDFARVARRISGDLAFAGQSDLTELLADPGRSTALAEDIAPPGAADVREVLDRFESKLSLEDFGILLSPAAGEFLEELAYKARFITRKRFGNTVGLYAPLYLSNECRSSCTYCGFSYDNDIRRITLSPEQIRQEADILYEQGLRHILLLTGEDYKRTPVDFIARAGRELSERFASVGIEVYPLKEEDYVLMREHNVDWLAVYQETYDPLRYRQVHLRGMKKRLEYRLDCPDRAGRAGMRKISIGALLGLSDPAAEVFFVGLHARHLMRTFWQTQISVSLPRLRPAAGFNSVPALSDRRFVQYLTALRIFLPDVTLVISTRESPTLRDNMVDICVNFMSAGSKTDPGGYSDQGATEQFAIEDNRSVAEVRLNAREERSRPAHDRLDSGHEVTPEIDSPSSAHAEANFLQKRSTTKTAWSAVLLSKEVTPAIAAAVFPGPRPGRPRRASAWTPCRYERRKEKNADAFGSRNLRYRPAGPGTPGS